MIYLRRQPVDKMKERARESETPRGLCFPSDNSSLILSQHTECKNKQNEKKKKQGFFFFFDSAAQFMNESGRCFPNTLVCQFPRLLFYQIKHDVSDPLCRTQRRAQVPSSVCRVIPSIINTFVLLLALLFIVGSFFFLSEYDSQNSFPRSGNDKVPNLDQEEPIGWLSRRHNFNSVTSKERGYVRSLLITLRNPPLIV